MNGFSEDGYIIDQNAFAGYPYRKMSSDVNGCGWIAAYNLRRAAGQDPDFDAVRRDMDAMIRLRVPGPTPMRVIRRYLADTAGTRYTAGKARALAAARDSRAGVLRYWEDKVPHFIAFLRLADGRYRFLNVADGQEDLTLPMDTFFETHCTRGYIRVLTI